MDGFRRAKNTIEARAHARNQLSNRTAKMKLVNFAADNVENLKPICQHYYAN